MNFFDFMVAPVSDPYFAVGLKAWAIVTLLIPVAIVMRDKLRGGPND